MRIWIQNRRRDMKISLVFWVAAIATLGGTARSQPVLIADSDATVGPLDTQILDQQSNTLVNLETAQITVRGRTLTVNGRHRIASLSIDSNAQIPGKITHDPGFSFDYGPGEELDIVRGMHLIVTDTVTVAGPGGTIAGGLISANACGYAAGTGPGTPSACNELGGAGHGGRGGNGNECEGGATYGSVTGPTDFGSGSSGTACGAAGGGTIRLEVGRALTVNGSITATGGNAACANGGSGGAGGSIWITCGQLSGYGSIASNGGYTPFTYRGAGGGGRIALYCTSDFFTGSVTAYGGNGSGVGGAGTIWTKTGTAATGSLRVVNWLRAASTPLPEDITQIDTLMITKSRLTIEHPLIANTVTIGNQGEITTTPGNVKRIQLSVAGDLLIEANGSIGVDAFGYAAGTGPGAPDACGWPGGAGHGAHGGIGRDGCSGGPFCGSVTKPTIPGSGGAGPAPGSSCGGSGGGALRLIVGGTLTVNGTLTASAGITNCQGGGGTGGSIWITCGSMEGSGSVRVRGGDGASDEDGRAAGAGAGGRVAVYSCDMTFPTTHIDVFSGFGYQHPNRELRAQPGTVFFGSSSVRVVHQTFTLATTVGKPANLGVLAQTSHPNPFLQYQWRRRDPSGEYIPLVEGQRFTGVTTPRLSLGSATCADSGVYDCIISDACGPLPTDDATLTVTNPADFNADGQIDFFDYLDFVQAFGDETPGADFDHNGQIDFFDYLDFVAVFDAGCD
jgi:hypothetical protein